MIQGEAATPAARTLRELGATVGVSELARGVQDSGFAWAFREARLDARGAWVWTEGRRSFACADARWWTRDEIVEHASGGARGEDRIEVLDLATFEHASWSRSPADARGDVLVQFVRQPEPRWWTLQGFVDPRLGDAVARDHREHSGARADLRFANLAGVEAALSIGVGEASGWLELAMGHERGSFHLLAGPPVRVSAGSRRVPSWLLERETRDGATTAVVFHALVGTAHAEEHVVPPGASVLDFRRSGVGVQSRALDRPTPLVEVGWSPSARAPERLAPQRTSFALDADCDLDHGDERSEAAASAAIRSAGPSSEPWIVTAAAWTPSAAGEELLGEVARSGFGLALRAFDARCPARDDGRHVVVAPSVDARGVAAHWAVEPRIPVPVLAAIDTIDDARIGCSRCGGTASSWLRSPDAPREPVARLQRPRARVRTASELVLRRVPGGDRPVGSLVLASDPSAEARPALVGFESGCGLALRGSLPIAIPPEGVEVLLEASASRSFESGPQGLASLTFDAGPPLRLPVRVVDLDPPCRVVPDTIGLAPTGESGCAIRVTAGDAAAVRDLVAPGCVRIEVVHACARHVSVRVREVDGARREHVCGPIVGLVERRGGSPFTVIARVEHRPLPRHGPAAVPLHLVVEPGARFRIAADGAGRLRALHPDRSPAVSGWVEALGWRVLARAEASEVGLVLEPLAPGSTLPAVEASFAPELAAFRDAWRSGG